jgi:NhaP-type Na+/H+ or K+/H+ antiporter
MKSCYSIFVFLSLICGFCLATTDDDSGQSIEVVTVLLFMFFGLALGVLLTQAVSNYGEVIPYTVLIFLIGMLFSTGASSSGPFADSIGQWLDIDAELLIYIFLPPLVFGEAMNLNWYHLKGGFIQSILLAGPGVLINAALMGVITKVLLPYNWCWNLVMTFGSILSATGELKTFV